MIKEIIKEWLRPIYSLLRTGNPSQIIALNLIKTIYWNFKLLEFNKAKKLPIFIYNKVKIYHFGFVSLNNMNITPGMIKIGHYGMKSSGFTKIENRGVIKFNGITHICGGTCLINSGTIEFMGDNSIAEGSIVLIKDGLYIGKNTRIGFLNMIQDSDDHYILDVKNFTVHNNTKPVIFHDNCWLGAKTCVKKGVILPEGTIVASANTLLTKDYSKIEPYSVLGGEPAKVIGLNKRRIVNRSIENELKNYFKEHSKEEYIFDSVEITDINKICSF